MLRTIQKHYTLVVLTQFNFYDFIFINFYHMVHICLLSQLLFNLNILNKVDFNLGFDKYWNWICLSCCMFDIKMTHVTEWLHIAPALALNCVTDHITYLRYLTPTQSPFIILTQYFTIMTKFVLTMSQPRIFILTFAQSSSDDRGNYWRMCLCRVSQCKGEGDNYYYFTQHCTMGCQRVIGCLMPLKVGLESRWEEE